MAAKKEQASSAASGRRTYRPLDPEVRRRKMASIHSADTQPELVLRAALRHAGLTGYRVHLRELPGKPDVAYTRWKVAVFVDGVFWHGHPDHFQVGSRRNPYWDTKITRNMARDQLTNHRLLELGWQVVRLWDVEVLRDARGAVEAVRQALARRASQTART